MHYHNAGVWVCVSRVHIYIPICSSELAEQFARNLL
jgi:hypothetical protein